MSYNSGVSGSPCSDNVLLWNAVIFGPEDTAFEDGTFKLLLSFDEGKFHAVSSNGYRYSIPNSLPNYIPRLSY